MKKLYCLVLVIFFILQSNKYLYAQSDSIYVVSGTYINVPFEDFIKDIEAKTPYRFFYNPTHTQNIQVHLTAESLPLEYILSKMFDGTAFYYAVDHENRVFIIKDRPVQADLPDKYFEPAKGQKPVSDVSIFDYLTSRQSHKSDAELKLYSIGSPTAQKEAGNATLAGYIRDAKTGEAMVGAAIFIDSPRIVVASNHSGFYSISLPKGRHELKVKSVGMKDTKRQIMVYADGKLDIEMEEDIIPLKEVIVEADKDVNVSSVQMGIERLDIKTIRQVPTAFGEADLLRVVLTLPGVKSVGESSTGLNVRGGAADQNLILLNDATIFNPSHLFGFFSAFNPDVVRNVELYKSNIPARLGGRLSSVLDVNTREGNKKAFSGSGGIGLITGRLTLEGPILKDKTSFLIGGRSTYSNWLLNRVPNPMVANSRASFYDVNAQLHHDFNEKNTLALSAYYSSDRFRLGYDTVFAYSNQAATLKWKHVFNNKFYSMFTGGYSGYDFSLTSERNPVTASRTRYGLNQVNVKADFSYFPNAKHTFDFGVSSIYYKLLPGQLQPLGTESLIAPDIVSAEQALESAIYISDRFDISSRLSLSVGLRYSFFNYLGAKEVYSYAAGLPRETHTILDTITYGANQVVNTYQGPEYRAALRYIITENTSIKASYNRNRQYLHMLTNTAMISPTDIWKLSDPHIRPQVGDQYSLGIFKNFAGNSVETSAEVYYKSMANVLDFKSGATLFLNHHIETDVLNAEGKAYGAEFMVKKMAGKLNGWVSYTYSRSLLRTTPFVNQEIINRGEYYPSNFDKPHDVSLAGNYKFSRRFSTSLNITYSTGRPITLPLAVYDLDGARRIHYSDRNQYRIPDYYRVDLAMNIEGNHKVKKLAHSSWTVAIYNLTGRKNPYSIFFLTENGVIRGYKLSVFGRPIPTITYNFKF